MSVRAKRFWKRMIQSWGARVADLYGTTCPEDWQAVIDRTDDERLDLALTALRQESPVHPPTLGQFESSIPRRERTRGDSIPDRLAQHVVKTIPMCEHQLSRPWTYFGEVTEEWYEPWKEVRKNCNTRGVVVPECRVCNRRSHRVRLEELPA